MNVGTSTEAARHFDAYYREWAASRKGDGAAGKRFRESEEIERRFFRAILKKIVRRVQLGPASPVTVLEVGSGPSLDLMWLEREVATRGVALDISLEALQFARRLQESEGTNVGLVVGDAGSASFRSGGFDLVYSQGVMEHFKDPWPAYREQVRLARPGGFLLMCVPQKYNVYTVRKHRMMRANQWPWGWEREYTVGELRRVARDLGLEPVFFCGFGYNRIMRIARDFYRLVRKKNPYRDHRFFGLLDWCYLTVIDPVLELCWRLFERSIGPYVLVNVVAVLRKPEGHEPEGHENE